MRLNDTLRPHKVNLKFMRSPDTCRSDIHGQDKPGGDALFASVVYQEFISIRA